MILTKRCGRCKQTLDVSNFNKNKKSVTGLTCYCKGCTRTINAQYYPRYKEKSKAYQKKYRTENHEKVKQYGRDRWKKDRIEVLIHYGGENPSCDCCGEIRYEFLAIDHINGGGGKQAKLINGKLVRWLRKNNFPIGFRVLCHNCNHSLGMHGYCPHKSI